ncbi:TMEM43 family protein, partial [Rhizobiaceae sp. 2RAB30]
MGDTFTETVRVSWFSRIKNSVVGVLIGLLLILGMVWLLFWNEGRTIREARSLTEGAGIVVSADAGAVDAANQGRLVHVTGPVITNSRPADDTFGIVVDGVRLVRNVEMYQWKQSSSSETTTKVGGGEETVSTYSYAKEWSDSPEDSSRFKVPAGHENPSMEIRNKTFQVSSGTLGAFDLDRQVLNGIGGDRTLDMTRDQAAAIKAAYGGAKRVTVADDRIYLGADPTSPAIGDYRISYTVAPLGVISVVAKQAGDGFEPYRTTVGNEILLVGDGDVPAAEMFASAQADNALLKWILRAVGLVVMFIGFTLIMGPLGVLADVLPPVGSLVRMGTGLVAFVLTVIIGSATIAIAWFWYRPLLSIVLI